MTCFGSNIEENRFALALKADIEAIFPLAGFLGDKRVHARALFDPVQKRIAEEARK